MRPVPDEPKTISVYPEIDEARFIANYARKQRLTLSQAVREAIRKLQELEEKGYISNLG